MNHQTPRFKLQGSFDHSAGTHADAEHNISAVVSLVLICAVVLLAGCKHTHPQHGFAQYPSVEATSRTNRPAGDLQQVSLTRKIDPAWLKPPSDLFTLGPGDHVEIEILGDPASRTLTIVGPDGKIYFNLLQGIDVWGATLSQAKAILEAELSKYSREKPQVSIVLRGIESKRVWILGRVQAPGVYAMTTPMTLLEAVSMAGGTMSLSNYRDQEAAGIGEELADLDRSFLIRGGKLMPVDFARLLKQGDISQNVYLEPDDFIYLRGAHSKEVYVLGAVLQPRAVAWSENLGVVGAVASAYGTIKYAYMSHVAVVRGSLTQPQMAIVDYKAVLKGEAQDLALLPGDIVYVPFSPYRYIEKYLELVLNTFVSASAINAGERAVTQQPTFGAGVFIPVGSGIQIIPPVNPPPVR
jgi:protein involved in polysaccharide export with SLBB domain